MLAHTQTRPAVITHLTVKDHFRETLATALANQQVAAEETTVYYLVNLLDRFSDPENLFVQTPDGARIPALAWLYGQALESSDWEHRQALLRRLGDTALLIGGVFPGSLARKPVDVDYYVGMGGSAYSYLSDMAGRSRRTRALHEVYAELSAKFQAFVDVLAEVSETSQLSQAPDLFRAYTLWAKTGSARAAARLRELGVEPLPAARHRRHN